MIICYIFEKHKDNNIRKICRKMNNNYKTLKIFVNKCSIKTTILIHIIAWSFIICYYITIYITFVIKI